MRFGHWLPVIAGLAATVLRAAEPWADSGLAVTNGLELWLDASRQPAAWQANRKPALLSDAAMDVWFDGSGHRRHAFQGAQGSQPRFIGVGEAGAVRFDGENDYFAAAVGGLKLEAFTVFVIVVPQSNLGGFRAFLAGHQAGLNDYTTGFTLDFGFAGSERFSSFNPEGKGFGGAVNVLTNAFAFRETRLLEVTADPATRWVSVRVDGQAAGRRPFTPESLAIDELMVGARVYSNTSDPPFVSGFLDGCVAEVLLFSRVLDEGEAGRVRSHLQAKYQGLERGLPSAAGGGTRLVTVKDPPVAQFLLPGFAVRELPLTLKNINNLRYRPDGKLVALGYDGNVWLLTDTDGDGLEDKAQLFWDNRNRLRAPIGMALTPRGYARGNGLFIPCKGKLSLVVDTNQDDVADLEIVVAEGWKELPHGVDALGVAIDPRDGSVYFGLGAEDFTNAYVVDPATGKARYSLQGEHGTILKVSADFQRREIVCTGIRFPVGLAFNRAGDLFCTDQEGATWLANGNPFDELLHIQPGRHYGFPPRHPRHLPGVIDEPSVYDYGPQHQSTCGLTFNEPVNGGPAFGPAWWAGEALVAGYSRGKLYRTSLAKTPAGYVAQNRLLACLNVLTVDATVSPQGGLVVATHSGPPDWGTGPTGLGRLFRVAYVETNRPQPSLVWAQSPHEVRVAFDRSLSPAALGALSGRAAISFGQFVRAGDRFETVRPGYEAVGRQMATPRFNLPVSSVAVTPDRRTIVLTTGPHAEAGHYGLSLAGFGSRPLAAGELHQHPDLDLDYDLCGLEARWQGAGPGPGSTWAGWLPHPDLAVARQLTIASAEHEALWNLTAQPGKLSMRCQLDLWDMLRPAIQPGSRIDYEWPPEVITITFNSGAGLVIRSPAPPDQVKVRKISEQESLLEVRPQEPDWLPLEIDVNTGPAAGLSLTWRTAEDPRPRALPLHGFLLPWATRKVPAPREEGPRPRPPELAGGSWARGRAVFFSEEALCAKCHTVGGRGAQIGPDLSNLIHRDYESVSRDIREPSATINPDFVPYELTLKDGEELSGTLRSEGAESVRVGLGPATETTVRRSDIVAMRPLECSIMPPALDQLLGPDRLKDLLTFLLTPPPHMGDYGPGKPPSSRTRDEVAALLQGAPTAPATTRPIRVRLVAGKKDHGPGEHDYPEWQRVWADLLGAAPSVTVSTSWDWPEPADWEQTDAVVFFQQGQWNPRRARDLDAFLARGGGASFLHYAVDGGTNALGCAERIGLAWQGGRSRFRHGELDLVFNPAAAAHPIARNFNTVRFHDETYWALEGDAARIQVLASAEEEGAPRPMFWTRETGPGRIFVSILGHYSWTFDDPCFRALILRGLAWTAHEPVDRFNEIITLGARTAD